eukprot:TRINITY_DN8615_c0_g1_i1.p1 TRINITY_DN8615_c0_g1~~TRINITY_DN8615_c0_g1_i1.p1  ORF type:complete len:159 (-),score=40.89 TRINITY_DN8615_c0_g1_i1:1089-1502(-)
MAVDAAAACASSEKLFHLGAAERLGFEADGALPPAVEVLRLQRLTWRPHLWVCDGFLRPAGCAIVRAAIERGAHGEGASKPSLNEEEEKVMQAIAERIGEMVQTPAHEAETPLAARRTPHSASCESARDFPLGLHVI